MKVHRVCPTFTQLETEALANRKALTIFVGENVDRKVLYKNELFFNPHLDTHTTLEAEVELAEHAALEMKTLDEEMVNWLKRTFLRVTKLRLVFGPNSDFCDGIHNVPQLLEHWAEKLNTFGIWAGYEFGSAMGLPLHYVNGIYQTPSNPFYSIFAYFNVKLHFLKYLTIALSMDRLAKLDHLDLSFLGQLKLFSTSHNSMQMIKYLKNYEPSLGSLPEIRLFKESKDDNFQAKLLEMPTRLAAKITALNMDYSSSNEESVGQLKTFFARYSALKWLSLRAKYNYAKLGIKHALIALSPISNLKFLNLSGVSFDLPEHFPFQEDLPPLSSLETLSISGEISNHHFLEPLGPLDRLFPALQCIKMIAYVHKRIECEDSIPEIVVPVIRRFAQFGLKGSLTVRFTSSYTHYTDEFNFSQGGRFEDWQYDKAKEIDEWADYYDLDHGYDGDFDLPSD